MQTVNAWRTEEDDSIRWNNSTAAAMSTSSVHHFEVYWSLCCHGKFRLIACMSVCLISRNHRSLGYCTSLPLAVCTSPFILKQSYLKTRTSTLNDATRKTVFNAKWLFKVICFDVYEKPLGTTYSDVIILVSYIYIYISDTLLSQIARTRQVSVWCPPPQQQPVTVV